MKIQYITPQSEVLHMQLSRGLLEDSLVDYYGGEDATPVDGTW